MRKGLTGTVVLALVVASLTLIGGAPSFARGAEPGGRWPVCGRWREVAVPRGGTLGSVRDVAVVSPNEAWIVTDYGEAGGNESHVYRWDGTRWSEVPFPTPRHERDHPYWALTAIETIAPHEVWAVGYRGLDRSHPISARWDGTRWRLVPIGLSGLQGGLEALTAIPGTAQLWAVGWGRARPLALRWDGASWHLTPTPHRDGPTTFMDVVATAGGATWAVGSVAAPRSHVLVSRWVGDAWTARLGPPGELTGIDGLTADSLWAVGWTRTSGSVRGRGIIMRRDARGWVVARRLDRVEELTAIEVVSPTDAWAVGDTWVEAVQTPRPFVLRRRGTRWRIDWAPRLDGGLSAIGGTPHDLWTFLGPLSELGTFVPYHRC